MLKEILSMAREIALDGAHRGMDAVAIFAKRKESANTLRVFRGHLCRIKDYRNGGESFCAIFDVS
jgi:hypothetical protein